MEKKTQRDSDRINQFQQKKLAEQLAIGMAVRNATLEQLGQEIITASAKAAGEEAASWAAKCQCAEQKQQYPSRTLCYSVFVALQAPPIIKIQQQENRAISNCDVEQLCALIRGSRRGTQAGQSLHEQQCCQAAPRRGSSEARANKEMSLVTN